MPAEGAADSFSLTDLPSSATLSWAVSGRPGSATGVSDAAKRSPAAAAASAPIGEARRIPLRLVVRMLAAVFTLRGPLTSRPAA